MRGVTTGRARHASVWVGVAFGLGCLVLFARNAHWEEIGRALGDASFPLIALAIIQLKLPETSGKELEETSALH